MNNEFTPSEELSMDINENEFNIKANRKAFKRAISKVTLMLLLLFLIALVASVAVLLISIIILLATSSTVINFSDPAAIMNDSLLMTINLFLPAFISLVCGIFIGKALFKIKFRELFLGKNNILKYSIKGALTCVGFGSIGLLFSLMITAFFNMFNLEATMADISLPSNPVLIIITLGYACLIGPIFEEIVFRGFILKAAKPLGTGFAIILSSILFGVFHGNLLQLVPATLMGLVLAYITIKSESLLPAIIAHIFNNSFRYLEESFYGAGFINTNYADAVMIAFTALTIIIALFFVFKDFNGIKNLKNNSSLYPISTGRKFLYSFISIPFILSFLYFVFNCISLFILAS